MVVTGQRISSQKGSYTGRGPRESSTMTLSLHPDKSKLPPENSEQMAHLQSSISILMDCSYEKNQMNSRTAPTLHTVLQHVILSNIYFM